MNEYDEQNMPFTLSQSDPANDNIDEDMGYGLPDNDSSGSGAIIGGSDPNNDNPANGGGKVINPADKAWYDSLPDSIKKAYDVLKGFLGSSTGIPGVNVGNAGIAGLLAYLASKYDTAKPSGGGVAKAYAGYTPLQRTMVTGPSAQPGIPGQPIARYAGVGNAPTAQLARGGLASIRAQDEYISRPVGEGATAAPTIPAKADISAGHKAAQAAQWKASEEKTGTPSAHYIDPATGHVALNPAFFTQNKPTTELLPAGMALDDGGAYTYASSADHNNQIWNWINNGLSDEWNNSDKGASGYMSPNEAAGIPSGGNVQPTSQLAPEKTSGVRDLLMGHINRGETSSINHILKQFNLYPSELERLFPEISVNDLLSMGVQVPQWRGYSGGGPVAMEDGGFVMTKKAVDGAGGHNGIRQLVPGAQPIHGPGTGTSDSIPAQIRSPQGAIPAALSNGEAYVPPDRVQQAGGSSAMYSLMNRLQKGR